MPFISQALPEFWDLYRALPLEIRKQARKQFQIFSQTPFHPSLHFKPVGTFWFVRVSRSYRALAVRCENHLFWFWIGSHRAYEQLLAK